MNFPASQTATATITAPPEVAPRVRATDWTLKPQSTRPESKSKPVVRARSGWQPAVEIQETADYLYVQLQLPGFTREEIEVRAFENSIVVQGAHFSSYGSSQGCVLASEFCYGTFERWVELPGAIAPDQVQAELCQGLLTLSLKKTAQ
jgi:HSP20 family molecular chaperone IbpA